MLYSFAGVGIQAALLGFAIATLGRKIPILARCAAATSSSYGPNGNSTY